MPFPPSSRFARVLWLAVLGFAGCGAATDYPNRSIVVVCPWAAGGGTDRVARFVADQLQRELGQPVIVQNQTGGSGATGHAAGARARPDGYTVTMGTFELSTMRSMGISDLTYRDFQPLAQVNADPAAIIIRKDADWNSLGDFLKDVRARPGTFKMSGTAAGGAWDLARCGLLLAADLPVDAVLWVPSQGSAPSLVELLGGHVDAVCCSVAEAQSQLEAGQLRALCVMSAERLRDYPDLPTVKEEGIDWEALGWRGLFLPRGTPNEIVKLLSEKIARVVESPAYCGFMAKNGFGSKLREGGEFTAFLDEQEQRWGKVVHAAGLSAAPGQTRVAASTDPGPWFFPRLLTIGIALGTCLILGRNALRSRATSAMVEAPQTNGSWLQFWREPGKRDVVALLIGLAVYLAAIPWLGFFVGTLLFSAGLMVRLGTRMGMAVAVSAGMLLGVYLLFVQQFRVVLPVSPWWPL